MKLYEIDREIEAAIDNSIDKDTGEIINNDELKKLESLWLDKKEKILDIGCVVLGYKKEEDIIASEIKKLQNRKDVISKNMKFLKNIIFESINEKIKDHRVSIYTVSTKSVQILDDNVIDKKYLKLKFEPMKKDIKDAILSGESVEGCEISENVSVVVR